MISSKLLILSASAASLGFLALGGSTASASEIAYFNFDSDTVNPTTAQPSSVTPPAGVTVGTLGIDPSYPAGRGTYDYAGQESGTALSYYNTNEIDAGDLAKSESLSDDLQVTITPQPGQPLTITSIELDGFYNGGAGDSTPQISVVDSVNGGTAPDGVVISNFAPGTPTTISGFTGLSGLTTPVTFSFYSTGVGAYVDKGIHSLEIDGTVGTPEPTAVGLLGIACAGSMIRRRRRLAKNA